MYNELTLEFANVSDDVWWCSLVALCAEEELQVSWGRLEAAGRTHCHCSNWWLSGVRARGRVLIGTNLQIITTTSTAFWIKTLMIACKGNSRACKMISYTLIVTDQ